MAQDEILEIFPEFFRGDFHISQNRAQKPRSNDLPGMNGDYRGSSIGMSEERVTSSNSNDVETDSFNNSHDFLARQARQPCHMQIC